MVAVAFAAAVVAAAPAARAQQTGARTDEVPAKPAHRPKLTRPPRLIQAAAPTYPKKALAAGLEANVKVRIHVDATGKVTKVDVVTPAGHGFDQAAVAAASQYRFQPAEFDGKPGPIVVETTIHFVIKQETGQGSGGAAGGSGSGANAAAGGAAHHGPASHAGDLRQPISVAGVALERGTGKRLAGVIVSIAQLDLDAVTDAGGNFYFHGVPPGKYKILAVDPAYARFTRSLEVHAKERVDVRLYMRPKNASRYETVVEGQRERLEVTRRTLSRRALTSVPGTFGDPLRVIQSLPGLARSPFMTGLLLIRGSDPNNSGVFIDGHQVPVLFHFLGGPSVLNSEFLKDVKLYPGGFPGRFGRLTGGVISVDTRSSKSDGVHGAADVNVLDADGYVRMPIGKHGSIAFAGRRSYLDFMLGFFLPKQSHGSTLIVVPVYYDYQGRFDYDFGKKNGHLSLFTIGSSDALNVLSQDPADAQFFNLDSSIRFLRVIGDYVRPLAPGWDLTISPAIGRDTISASEGQFAAGSAYTQLGVGDDTTSYRMSARGHASKHIYVDTGLDIASRVTHYSVRAPVQPNVPAPGRVDTPPEQIEQTADMLGYAAYADVGIDLGKWHIIPSLRVDGYVLSGQPLFSIDPRLVLRYDVNDRWTAKAYAGVFHQAPQPEQMDPQFGNPNLGPEVAYQTGVGAEWKPARHWSTDAEAYYIDRRNTVQYTSDTVTNPNTGNVTPINFLNSGDGNTFGLEVLIKRQVTKRLFGWLSYTLSRTVERDNPSEAYHPATFDERHVLNAVASYRIGDGWELGGRFQLATGRPTTPVLGGTFNADSGGYLPLRGATGSTRVKTYIQLDVRAEKKWTFDRWNLSVYLDLINALDRQNVEATQYDYRFQQSSPVSGVPLVPTLGIKGSF